MEWSWPCIALQATKGKSHVDCSCCWDGRLESGIYGLHEQCPFKATRLSLFITKEKIRFLELCRSSTKACIIQ